MTSFIIISGKYNKQNRAAFMVSLRFGLRRSTVLWLSGPLPVWTPVLSSFPRKNVHVLFLTHAALVIYGYVRRRFVMNNICHLRSIIHLQVKQKLEYALIWNDSVEPDPWCFPTTCCLLFFFFFCHLSRSNLFSPKCNWTRSPYIRAQTQRSFNLPPAALKNETQLYAAENGMGMQHMHFGKYFAHIHQCCETMSI